MKDNPVQQIMDAKKISLEDGDVLFVTYSKYDPEDLTKILQEFLEPHKEKDIQCVFFPEDINVYKKNKEDAIKDLESIIESLKK